MDRNPSSGCVSSDLLQQADFVRENPDAIVGAAIQILSELFVLHSYDWDLVKKVVLSAITFREIRSSLVDPQDTFLKLQTSGLPNPNPFLYAAALMLLIECFDELKDMAIARMNQEGVLIDGAVARETGCMHDIMVAVEAGVVKVVVAVNAGKVLNGGQVPDA